VADIAFGHCCHRGDLDYYCDCLSLHAINSGSVPKDKMTAEKKGCLNAILHLFESKKPSPKVRLANPVSILGSALPDTPIQVQPIQPENYPTACAMIFYRPPKPLSFKCSNPWSAPDWSFVPRFLWPNFSLCPTANLFKPIKTRSTASAWISCFAIPKRSNRSSQSNWTIPATPVPTARNAMPSWKKSSQRRNCLCCASLPADL